LPWSRKTWSKSQKSSTRSFLESHINTERLARDLHGDVHSERYDYLSELDAEDFWRQAEGYLDVPDLDEPTDEDDDPVLRDPTSSEIDDLADKQTDEVLKDPMEYLTDLHGATEAVAMAIKLAGFDVSAAAEEVVDTDGEGHFLSHYDGHMHDSPSGLVYWRTN